ncbi:MAG: histidine kinase [Nocardioides sp.]
MSWGGIDRQAAWLAVGARCFALIVIAVPILLAHERTLLLALLTVTSVWLAAMAGERLNVPVMMLLVLESASIGAAAGLSAHRMLAVLGAMAVPPFVAGLKRGGRGVAVSLAAELAVFVLSAHNLDQEQALSAFTWSVVGLGLGLIASFLHANLTANPDPLRAYRTAQALIRELIDLSGGLSSGLDPVALAGGIASSVQDVLPSVSLAIDVPVGLELTPLLAPVVAGTQPGSGAEATRAALARECWVSGGVRVDGHCFAFALTTDLARVAVVSGILSPGLDPSEIGLAPTLAALNRQLEPAAVRLDTALLFAAFRDAATTTERHRLAREMHDGVAQEIASLGYLVDEIQAAKPHQQADQLAWLRHRLTAVVGEVRRSVQTLRTDIGENQSLGTAIGALARHLSASSGLTIHVTLEEGTTRLRPEVESELLRITQEAMNNAVRHARASAVEVRCTVAPPYAEITVADDGGGLQPGREDSHGIEIMHERAHLVDAELSIGPRLPRGTVVAVRLNHGVSLSQTSAEPDTLPA